jgi:hypothetical protein
MRHRELEGARAMVLLCQSRPLMLNLLRTLAVAIEMRPATLPMAEGVLNIGMRMAMSDVMIKQTTGGAMISGTETDATNTVKTSMTVFVETIDDEITTTAKDKTDSTNATGSIIN